MGGKKDEGSETGAVAERGGEKDAAGGRSIPVENEER
jgi:hypothetical protein